MSLNLEGKSCPICKAYLFKEDDIVVCPVCGAPHHRDCFNSLGKCGLSELHGTDKQYDLLIKQQKEKEAELAKAKEQKEDFVPRIKCPSCGNIYTADSEKCPSCGARNAAYGRQFVMFDLLGGVEKNTDIGRGITAETAKDFVLSSTARIIPKFLAFKNGAKTSWNWWSFLFPTAHFAGRKMYLAALFSGMVQVASTLFSYPFSLKMAGITLKTVEDVQAFMQTQYTPETMGLWVLAMIGLGLMLALRIFCGLFTDKIYYNHSLNTISSLNELYSGQELKEEMRRKGGINLLGFSIALLAVNYLPSIIASLIL